MHPIYKYLKQNKMSQPDLANKLDITTEYLHMILRGRRWPSLKLACRISEITGVDALKLMKLNRFN